MNINRRDFLKFASLLPAAGMPVYRAEPKFTAPAQGLPNILIVVFDAFSATNMSLSGYPRQTTPLLQSLADKAIIYHNHHAAGSYTTPGTASLLTGTLPWSHRAINPADRIVRPLVPLNVFKQLEDHYYRVGYSHNYFADDLLRQFMPSIDGYLPRQDLFLVDDWVGRMFIDDYDTAFIAALKAYQDITVKIKNTLYVSRLYKKYFDQAKLLIDEKFGNEFPRGIPSISGQDYILEDAIDWLGENLPQIPQPFFSYFHLFPPHAPYRTRKEFVDIHNDGYKPPAKPRHPINFEPHVRISKMQRLRREYDEFVNYVDAEFYRLYQSLEAGGLLEDTWVILTSDHGEMFERGIEGHVGYTLHQPMTNIPLMIFPPRQEQRMDVYENTSALDIVPSVLSLAGLQAPEAYEGRVIVPGGQQSNNNSRPVFCVQAKGNKPGRTFKQGTVMMLQDNYKMIYYFGYSLIPEGNEYIEFYDMEQDPDELENLYTVDHPVAAQMRAQIIARLEEGDDLYR